MNNESMVYLNKIFTDVVAQSCPLMEDFVADSDAFEQQLSLFEPTSENGDFNCGCNCGCNCNCNRINNFEFDEDTNFVVDSTEVFINDFNLVRSDCLKPCDVTVDGIPVDALDFFNERFMASTNNLMARISDCTCLERGLSTRAMLLIRNAGDWKAKVTIVLRGSVFRCSNCMRFKLIMTTKECVFINIPGSSTFAVTSICLPCTTGGIAPIINFSFRAKATLLNPMIFVESEGGCRVRVTGNLITEPFADIQVTRQTLFRTRDSIIDQACDDLRRCNQFPGTCNCEEDDDSNAYRLRNRCCNDGREDRDRDDDDDDDECRSNRSRQSRSRNRDDDDDDDECGRRRSGQNRSRDRDDDDDDDDECGRNRSRQSRSRDRDADDDDTCSSNRTSRSTFNRQISCQWNGCNGCGF